MKRLALVLWVMTFSVTAMCQSSGKIFAVRHAEKQSDEADTPLSNLGQARADCLAQTLKDVHISSIFTTQYIRTKQTAAPTAHETNIKETVIDAKTNPELVKAAKQASQAGNVLIVGHSNTIPAILAALGAPTVTIPDSAYDLLFIVDAASPQQLTTLHYCPNLPKDATAHTSNSMAKP
jgi:broad specificity phosphatase PhoE